MHPILLYNRNTKHTTLHTIIETLLCRSLFCDHIANQATYVFHVSPSSIIVYMISHTNETIKLHCSQTTFN